MVGIFKLWLGFKVFNATFNNVSVLSWRSVLLVEKTTDLSQVTDKLYYIMLYTSPWSRFELTTPVVIGTGCIGSCKANCHTITATTATFCVSRNPLIRLYQGNPDKNHKLWNIGSTKRYILRKQVLLECCYI